MRIVLANGVFDILHVGHVMHLKEAATMGDKLIVSITNDKFVGKGPGRPINDWIARAKVVDSLRWVHHVLPTNNACDAIRMVRPHIFVKGIDYAGGDKFSEAILEACREVGAEIRYTSSPKMSATDIIRKSMELPA